MENIRMIDIELIHQHPDNPRKDVGDVTELAESIKQQGIMQNLTVVPFVSKFNKNFNGEGMFTVIIGHRRLAAAKLAGLKEVPCVVVEMSEKEQLAVMLSENMQRVDLTLVEQAQGMQLMLDMGDTVPEIAKKTGLSNATVGKRIKINSLPADKLKAAESRGGTLEAYLKCLEIKDEKKRVMLLDKVGTADFEWNFKRAKDEQVTKQNKPIMLALLKNIGAEKLVNPSDRWSSKYESVLYKTCSSWDGEDFTKKLKKGKKYFYFVDDSQISIYQKAEKKKNVSTKSKKEIEADRRRKELKALFDNAYSLREEFVLNFNETKKHEKVIYDYLLKFIGRSAVGYFSRESNIVCKAADVDVREGYVPNQREKICEWIQNDKNASLVLAFYQSGDSKSLNCYSYSYGKNYPKYSKNETLFLVYEFLGKLGYQVSTEEEKLINGTHELYEED